MTQTVGFDTKEHGRINIVLQGSHPGEQLQESDYGHAVWPASYVLANYISENYGEIFSGRGSIELGAGQGLPSLLLCELSRLNGESPDSVEHWATDGNESVVAALEANRGLNEGSSKALKVAKLDLSDLNVSVPIDYKKRYVLLASDLLYAKDAFEDFFRSVSALLWSHGAIESMYMTYQVRSTRRSFEPYLQRWRLRCEPIAHRDGGTKARQTAAVYLMKIERAANPRDRTYPTRVD